MKFPRCNRAIVLYAALYIDDTGRSEIRPGKLFLPCPNDFDWLLRHLGQTCSFNGAFAAMFATVTRPCVWNDHTNLLGRDVKRFGKFAAHTERPLRSGPNC